MISAIHQNGYAHNSFDTKDEHRESERARLNFELSSVCRVIDCGHCPGQPNAQEDVDGVGAGHVTDGPVRCLVIYSCNFASECIC